MNAPLPLDIRWMNRRDLPQVLEIERRSFEFSWCEQDFVRTLRHRNCVALVAERRERVAGFTVYELHRTRLHVINLGVCPALRRLGIAKAIVDKLKSKLSPQRRTRILLEVRETNLAAQLFFRAQGFRAVSILRDFYDLTTEDAYLFEHSLQHGGNHASRYEAAAAAQE